MQQFSISYTKAMNVGCGRVGALFQGRQAVRVEKRGSRVNRKRLLAVETFAYSYTHYADHLGVNVRFDRGMTRDVDTLERAERKGVEPSSWCVN